MSAPALTHHTTGIGGSALRVAVPARGFISELESFEGITANVVITFDTFDELQQLAKGGAGEVFADHDDHAARIHRVRISLQPRDGFTLLAQRVRPSVPGRANPHSPRPGSRGHLH